VSVEEGDEVTVIGTGMAGFETPCRVAFRYSVSFPTLLPAVKVTVGVVEEFRAPTVFVRCHE
jgi:hypothetical protein